MGGGVAGAGGKNLPRNYHRQTAAPQWTGVKNVTKILGMQRMVQNREASQHILTNLMLIP